MNIDNKTKLIARKNARDEMNYYIRTASNEEIYAFTKPYSLKTWELCKSGIRLNELMRKSHEAIMLLVKYTRYIMPYLCEEYGLAATE